MIKALNVSVEKPNILGSLAELEIDADDLSLTIQLDSKTLVALLKGSLQRVDVLHMTLEAREAVSALSMILTQDEFLNRI